jgi:hypothetical protein
MKIHIEFEMTPGMKKTAAVAAMMAVLAVGTAAYAQPAPSSESVSTSTLSSAVAALQAQVAGLRAVEHVDRATLSASGDVVTQNGAWLARVDHPSAGGYVVRFAPGAFSARPTCVAIALANDLVFPDAVIGTVLGAPVLACTSATLTSLTCQARDRPGSGGVDTGISVICMGP